ncbi:MAG: VOC family protein [Marinilabiliaceae bacterium]|nr:VOC family protein [Marinilabiliaceae bacterium]
MKFICPLIVVADMPRARHFYEQVLNQTMKYDFGENVTYQGDFAIHQQSHFSRLIDEKPMVAPSNSFELYFEEDDLLPLIDKLKAYGVEFVHELREQPWRQRVVRFYDPDHNMIEIGESMEYLCFRLYKEGASVEELAQISNMPVSFVNAAIAQFINQEL